MKTLDEIMIAHDADKGSRWHQYTERYEKYFQHPRNAPITLLEAGVQFGNSMRGWLEYFPNPDARFFGVDVGNTHKIEDPRYQFFLCDQTNADTLPLPMLDIVIDDAGHIAAPMMECFRHLWPKVKRNGIYALEDVAVFWDDDYHPSAPLGQMWLSQLIGHVNLSGKRYYGKPKPNPDVDLTDLERTIDFVHFYRGLVIIGKK